MDAPKAKADLTTTQAVKLRARQFTAVAGDKFKVASASISRSDTQARLEAAARRCRRRRLSRAGLFLAIGASSRSCHLAGASCTLPALAPRLGRPGRLCSSHRQEHGHQPAKTQDDGSERASTLQSAPWK
jgi:hypothetical protein